MDWVVAKMKLRFLFGRSMRFLGPMSLQSCKGDEFNIIQPVVRGAFKIVVA